MVDLLTLVKNERRELNREKLWGFFGYLNLSNQHRGLKFCKKIVITFSQWEITQLKINTEQKIEILNSRLGIVTNLCAYNIVSRNANGRVTVMTVLKVNYCTYYLYCAQTHNCYSVSRNANDRATLMTMLKVTLFRVLSPLRSDAYCVGQNDCVYYSI